MFLSIHEVFLTREVLPRGLSPTPFYFFLHVFFFLHTGRLGQSDEGSVLRSDSSKASRKSSLLPDDPDRLKLILDETVASECPLCGSIMINLVSRSVLDPADPELAEWMLS